MNIISRRRSSDHNRGFLTFGLATALIGLALAVAWPPVSPAGGGGASAETVAPLRTIHVDFESGDDAQNGLAPETARRTVPPPEEIAPGDRILFKGGVRYLPSVRIETGGTADAPVVYDGNSRGEWGEGRAILDGSRPLGPWTRAGETAGGLAIWRAEAPKFLRDNLSHDDLVIFQDGRRARLASSANLTDNWILPEWNVYFSVPRNQAEDDSITDPSILTRLSDDWAEASILLHHGHNHLNAFPVVGIDREAGTVRFSGARKLHRGDYIRYAVLNHRDVFDAPGEFLVRTTEGSVLYIPFDGVDPNDADIRFNAGYFGFINPEAHNVHIRGFRITGHRRFAVAAGDKRKPHRTHGLRVEDNEIERGGQIIVSRQVDFAIVGNRLREILPNRPIHVTRSDAGRIEGNVLRRAQSGITAYGATNSLFKDNDVRGIMGVHGNAMTIYEGSHNTRIIGNRLSARRGLTLRDSDALLIAFNRISSSRFALAQWAPLDSGVRLAIANNTFAGPVLIRTETAKLTDFRNNIVHRFAMQVPAAMAVRRHNLYGEFGHRTVSRQDFRAGEVHMPLDRALLGLAQLDMTPSAEGLSLLARGEPIDMAGMTVAHIGAVQPNGRLPDLSLLGLPPHDPSVAP